MKWLQLKKNESENIFSYWNEQPVPDYDPSYEKIRTDLVNIFNITRDELNTTNQDIPKKGYAFDLLFGLRLYELFQNQGLNLRDATDDGFWRYLSIKVAPDLIFHRWGLRPERFWSRGRRIWLKTLWWYIHLSFQGTVDRTHKTLRNNTSDEIVQLVERAGQFGYRVDLYREIMKQYGPIAENSKESSSLFRKVMKLNTARCKMIEPQLVTGGLQAYVRELFEYFDNGK